MKKIIVRYGIIAGLIIVIPMFIFMMSLPADARLEDMGGVLPAYIAMLVALSMVFLGIKRYRDRDLGGVIRFGQAFIVGLGITAVASLLYVIGWEISSATSKVDFATMYANSIVEAARAKGATAEEIASASAQAQQFTQTYANPLFRMPMVFLEMFPVGILVSLVSAALLRNSRLLAARGGTT